jgi:phage terminase large subunit-like protein
MTDSLIDTLPSDLKKMAEKHPEGLLEILEAQIAQEEMRNRLATFVPSVPQEQLMLAIGQCQETHITKFVIPSGNSAGKTAVTINILGNLIWGPQSRWAQGEAYTNWTSPKKIWYVSEQTVLKEHIVGASNHNGSEIAKWFPAGRYKIQKGGLDYFSQFKSDSGWEMVFKTFDQESTKFAGAKVGVIVFDEPPPEQIYNECLARLTLGGIVIMPMTPLYSSAWIEDRLLTNRKENTFVLQAPVESACKQHSVRGFLDHDVIEALMADYPVDERDARINGTFAHLTGLVYKGLHEDTHRHRKDVDDFHQDKYRIFCVIDPHDARPPFIGWFAVDRMERAYAIAEYPKFSEYGRFNDIKNWRLTNKQVGMEIKELEHACGWNPRRIIRVMDPNWGVTNDASIGKTTQQEFSSIGKEIGWPMYFSCNVIDNVEQGHEVVNQWIRATPDKEYRFKVSNTGACDNLWHHLTHYKYDPRTGKSLDKHGVGNRVEKRYKDGADVVRYFFMYLSKPQSVDTEPDEQESKLTKRRMARLYKKAHTPTWKDPYAV